MSVLEEVVHNLTTCVYAIAYNEFENVDKFIANCQDASYVVVCDTGSTDGTYERLKTYESAKVHIHRINITPWRFDVARNTALALVPPDVDVCISLDLDERLNSGWNEAFDTPYNATRYMYNYVWKYDSAGTTPEVQFFTDKIHSRFGYVWRHACHETLYWVGDGEEKSTLLTKLQIGHYPDPSKSRSQYMGLLEMAIGEEPTHSRVCFYYARELMFAQKWEAAIIEFKRHLQLPTSKWKEERANSWQFVADCHSALKQPAESLTAAIQSTLECPSIRETWLSVAKYAYQMQDWITCIWAAHKALAIEKPTNTYIIKSDSWGPLLYDYLAIGYWHLENPITAFKYGQLAVSKAPTDQRLLRNLEVYKSALPA